MELPKVCLIVVYFGKWPKYMNYFLKSCKTNPSIDFIFFSDNDSLEYDGHNIKLIPFTLNDFNTLASQKLGLEICVSEPYKLCDFKPLYGVMFENYLKGYAFWGHCDIDVVFGNIRKFITTDRLDKYDIISARKEFMCGHFTLFRNIKTINELFRESADHEKVVTDPSHCYSFDECGRLWFELLRGDSIWDCNSPIDSMTHVVKRLEKKGNLTCYFETMVSEPDQHVDKNLALKRYKEELLWDHGTLTAPTKKKEFMHFHSNVLKRWRHFDIPDSVKIPDKFYISESGFTINPLKKIFRYLRMLSS
jgi:hypothetical protein